jgi:septal ring factor EnvC (AmiA/AmiB activator)
MGELDKLQKDAQDQTALGQDLLQARQESDRLRRELDQQKQRCIALETEHDAAQRSLDSLSRQLKRVEKENERLRSIENRTDSSERDHTSSPVADNLKMSSHSVEYAKRSNLRGPDGDDYPAHGKPNESHSRSRSRSFGRKESQQENVLRGNIPEQFTVDGTAYEISFEQGMGGGGGVATSTPHHYGLHPSSTAEQAIEQKNNLIALYRVQIYVFLS